MKTLLLGLIGALTLVSAQAQETAKETAKETKKAKPTRVVGQVKCAHCDFAVLESCAKAVKMKKGGIFVLEGEKVKTFFDENKEAKRVRATGKATKKEGYTSLAVAKINVPKKKNAKAGGKKKAGKKNKEKKAEKKADA